MHFYNEYKREFFVIVSALLVYVISICIIYKNIKKQERELNYSRMVQQSTTVMKKITDYIGPVHDLASFVTDITTLCRTNRESVVQADSNPFVYLLKNYDQFSSVFAVFQNGTGYGMGHLGRDTLFFVSFPEGGRGATAHFYRLIPDKSGTYQIISHKIFKSKIDLSNRPWVKATINENEIYCTDFYRFYFSNKYGLTLSRKINIKHPDGSSQYLVLGFDILANDVMNFLQSAKESIKGDVFLLDDSHKAISPSSGAGNTGDGPAFMQEKDKTAIYKAAATEYLRSGQPGKPFGFSWDGRDWNAYIKKIDLSKNRTLYLGIISTNSHVQILFQTRLILLVSIILIVLLILYLVYTIREKQKKNTLLIEKNLALASSANRLTEPGKAEGNIASPGVNTDSFILNSRTTLRILDELENLISDKFYLSQDATLYNISKTLGTNTTYLSKVINNYKGKSYSDFLNELRINEAIMRIVKGEVLKKYSLEGFAHELGFKSKSSFNNAFKKYTGITPSEFIASTKNKSL